MAEAWLRHLAAEQYPEMGISTSSAGLEAHGLNAGAVKAMADQGIDISSHSSDVLSTEMIDAADLVVTVCAHADANCPLVPPNKQKLHIPFTDPAKASGSPEEIAECFEQVCLQIRDQMKALLVKLKTNKI
jgi:arsenate reductase